MMSSASGGLSTWSLWTPPRLGLVGGQLRRPLGTKTRMDILKSSEKRSMMASGGQGQNRTADTRIFSPLLYRLSYLAKCLP